MMVILSCYPTLYENRKEMFIIFLKDDMSNVCAPRKKHPVQDVFDA